MFVKDLRKPISPEKRATLSLKSFGSTKTVSDPLEDVDLDNH